MKTFYFIYKRIGKKQSLNLWAIIDTVSDIKSAKSEFERTLFVGDFKYQFIAIIENKD